MTIRYTSVNNSRYEDFKWWVEEHDLELVGLGLFLLFALLIGVMFYANSIRYEELRAVGCEHTPVNWANGSFYTTDNDWACPYQR